jgi:anti-sigma B factor antagonist
MNATATTSPEQEVCKGMRAGPLTMRAFEEPNRHVLELRGELDTSSAHAFEEAAARVRALGANELLLDISGVEFIDSNGLRSILAVKAACEEHACAFTVTHGSEQVDRVFELTRLLERLPFRRSRREGHRRELQLWA